MSGTSDPPIVVSSSSSRASTKPKKVVIVERSLNGYRIPFHEALRDRLKRRNIHYRLVHGKCVAHREGGHVAPPDWAEMLQNRPRRVLGIDLKAILRPALPPVDSADLIILGDDDTPLLDYLLQGRAALLKKPKLALWRYGPAANGRARGPVRKSLQNFWANRAHWWFVDSDRAAKALEERGFPPHQITRYDDAVDCRGAISDAGTVSDEDVLAAKHKLGIMSNNVGLFLGPLEPDRRLTFAIEAANRVRMQMPDFHLLIIGGGAEETMARDAHRRRFMHYLGPLAGREKAIHAKIAKVLVMPGRVRLDMLEGFAFGLPAVTTAAIDPDSRFDALSPGESGVIANDANDVEAYASAIVDILRDEPTRFQLARMGHEAVRERYTVDAMVERFADGILRALS